MLFLVNTTPLISLSVQLFLEDNYFPVNRLFLYHNGHKSADVYGMYLFLELL